jgi:formylglycine-generating enzyme required for sulfatase activity
MRFAILAPGLALLLTAGCGGEFTAPLSDDLVEPLLVLDLGDGTLSRAPEGVVPTGRRLVFRRMPSGSRHVATSDTLGEAGAVDADTVASAGSTKLWLCTHELSQAQWNRLAPEMADPWNLITPLATGGGSAAVGGDMPAWGLDANSVIAACGVWSDAHSGYTLRLPSAAEWESAARAADPGLYGWGDSEAPAATYARVRETGSGPRPISGHPALGGFLDMHGNVWEWVSDDLTYHLRGGSWSDNLRSARSGNRRECPSDVGYALAGVRLMLALP